MTTLVSPISTRPRRCADGDLAEVVAFLRLAGDLGDHLLGHLRVGLVLEGDHVAAPRLLADGALERCDRARTLVRDFGDDSVEIQRALDEADCAAGHGWDERDLVAVGQALISRGVFAVHGIEQPGRLVAQRERIPHIADGRSVGELKLALHPFPRAPEGPRRVEPTLALGAA